MASKKEAVAASEPHQVNASRPDLALPERDAEMEAVAARHAHIRDKWRVHMRTEVDHVVHGVSTGDGHDAGDVRISSAQGRVYMTISHPCVVLDHDGIADLYRKVAQLFQAVS